jgi:hypothetical protein
MFTALALALLPQTDAHAAWSEDVLHLVAEIERLHPAPFGACPREEFEAGVDELLARVAEADEPHALVELMRLVARLTRGGRDGHTLVWPQRARALPLRLHHFEDGWFVVAADDAFGEWVGAELVGVGGVPVEKACARLAPLLTCDNEWNRRAKLAEALACAEMLVGVDLGTDPTRVRVELARADERHALELPCGPRHPCGAIGLPERGGALWLRGREQAFRMEVLEAERALYVQYNEVTARAAGGRTLSDFAAELVRTFEERELAKVILDVRSNGGGDNTTFGPLITALRSPALDRPGVLYGLVGRHTFSAAGNFAAVLERDTHATLVGEPTGGAPNQFGDAVTVTLPHHPEILVRIATRTHTFVAADDPRLAVEVDLAVPLSSADYFAGRDPVLAAALAHVPGR